jgi:hypothetical protein
MEYWAKHTQHHLVPSAKDEHVLDSDVCCAGSYIFRGARTMQDRIKSLLIAPGGLFESSKEALSGKQRVDLLKAIEGVSR